MKFMLPFVALATSAIAFEGTPVKREPSLVERDLATITGALNTINQDVEALNTAVKAWNGGAPDPVVQANEKVLNDIRQANTEIAGTSSISLTDSLTLQSTVQGLTGTIETAVNSIIAKKDAFTSAGVAGTVAQGLQDQFDGASQLSKTISGKVPPSLSSLATTLSAGITDNLQKGINAYQGAADSPSGGAGGASSAPAPAPSAPASSPSAPASAPAETPSSSAAAAPVPAPASTPSTAAIPPSGNDTSSPPAQFTGAASANGFSFGAVVMAAAAMML